MRKVTIAGGGIAGPVLGMGLRELGFEVTLHEARPAAASSEGAFLGVAPNGMNALAQLGIAEKVEAAGTPCDAFQFLNAKGRVIGSIDRSGDLHDFGRSLTMIRRGELHALLAEEARRRGVTMYFGSRLVAIDDSRPDGVVARFEAGEERADVLVGCDGLRSKVRSLVLPQAPAPNFTGLLDFGGFTRGVDLPFAPGVNLMVFGRRAFFGAFVTPSREVWWFHNGPPQADGASGRESILSLHREDPRWIQEVVKATPEVLGPWPIHELDGMPRWHQGRVCLIGDAAHAMSPSAGQGASMAIEDALVLAHCLRDAADPTQAFSDFEAARRPRVDPIFRQAQRISSRKTPQSAVSEWFRDRMLPVFLKLGASAQNRSYGYRLELTERRA